MTLFSPQLREVPKRSTKKTVIVTGGNSGIGLAAAKELAATGRWNIVLACRSLEKANMAMDSISNGKENVEARQLDLSDLKSVEKFSREWGNRQLDCLALNAGVHTGYRTVPLHSKQGYELTVATNHIGHFHLTELLRKKRGMARTGRIVYVASSLHYGKPGTSMLGELKGLEMGFKAPTFSMVSGAPFNSDQAYKDSKLCNVMTTLELSRRLKQEKSQVTCTCMSPGLIPTTGLFREYNPYFVWIFNYFMLNVFKVAVSEEEGGKRLAELIDSDAVEGMTGVYFARNSKTGKFEEVAPSEEAQDIKKASKLWTLTHKLIQSDKD